MEVSFTEPNGEQRFAAPPRLPITLPLQMSEGISKGRASKSHSSEFGIDWQHIWSSATGGRAAFHRPDRAEESQARFQGPQENAPHLLINNPRGAHFFKAFFSPKATSKRAMCKSKMDLAYLNSVWVSSSEKSHAVPTLPWGRFSDRDSHG